MAQNAELLQGQKPLTGVVLCFTSVPQDVRTNLADVAGAMGAVQKLDLTSDVTHLVVGSIVTPKYQYVAKERPDIKVLLPSWISAVRESWMEGGDVDVPSLEREHHCPPFAGLQVCLTGFDNLEQRNYISSMVAEKGATYHGDLTKAVTHLITATPSGQKYTHAKRWNVPVVSLKWFEDSLERGMALDERFYDPAAPLDEQGKGAFKQQRTNLGKHRREGDAPTTGNTDLVRKKLRRTASTRLESQSQDMWQDMSAEPTKTADPQVDSWKDDASQSPTGSTSRPVPKSKVNIGQIESKEEVQLGGPSEALFAGQHCLIHRFEQQRTALLERVLLQNGATIAHDASELQRSSGPPVYKARRILVPHAGARTGFNLPDIPTGVTLATEWWVERCIHYKRLLDPAEDTLSRPIWDAEISGFGDLYISTTGFSGVDLRQIAETVKLTGATYQEKVLPSTSVIVSGSNEVRREKAFYARKHQIPVVSVDWLWGCLKSNRSISFDTFRLELPAFDNKDFNETRATSSPAPSDVRHREAEDLAKRKDESKRLSNSRKRQITPSLALRAPKLSPAAKVPRIEPIYYEEFDDLPASESHADQALSISQPLKDVSPNLSPGKGLAEAMQTDAEREANKDRDAAKSFLHSVSPSKSRSTTVPTHTEEFLTGADALPAARTHHELTADLAGLLNKKVASRPSSASPADAPPRRKSRPLGRASSGVSNRSLSGTGSAPTQRLSSLVTEHDNIVQDALPPPSTQLGYETPEAQAHRLEMSKKMGTKLHDEADMRRVPSLGVVKDTSLLADSGVGNRVRGRARAK